MNQLQQFDFEELIHICYALEAYDKAVKAGIPGTTPENYPIDSVGVFTLRMKLSALAGMSIGHRTEDEEHHITGWPLVIGWTYYVDQIDHPNDGVRFVLEGIHDGNAILHRVVLGEKQTVVVSKDIIKPSASTWHSQIPAKITRAKQRADDDFRAGEGQDFNPYDKISQPMQWEAYAWRMHQLWHQEFLDDQARAPAEQVASGDNND